MKYAILDENGKQFLNRAAELLKAGCKFVYVLDNIDWEEKVHDMRQEVQTRSVHAFATSIVFDRVSSQGLPDSGPQQSLKDCNVLQVVDINPEELEAIRKRYTKYLLDNFYLNIFQLLKCLNHSSLQVLAVINIARKCQLSQKFLTMPILMTNEKKYSECVDVLDQLEKLTQEIYFSAGLCSGNAADDDEIPHPIQAHSRPDQPAAHVLPVSSNNDPLHGVKIPCFGDQLTRVRFSGPRDLRPAAILQSTRWIISIHLSLVTGMPREVTFMSNIMNK